MKRESHAMLAHQTKQVTFLLPKIGTQNETLDSDIKEGCQVVDMIPAEDCAMFGSTFEVCEFHLDI